MWILVTLLQKTCAWFEVLLKLSWRVSLIWKLTAVSWTQSSQNKIFRLFLFLCSSSLVWVIRRGKAFSLRKHPFLLRSRAKEKRMLSQARKHCLHLWTLYWHDHTITRDHLSRDWYYKNIVLPLKLFFRLCPTSRSNTVNRQSTAVLVCT